MLAKSSTSSSTFVVVDLELDLEMEPVVFLYIRIEFNTIDISSVCNIILTFSQSRCTCFSSPFTLVPFGPNKTTRRCLEATFIVPCNMYLKLSHHFNFSHLFVDGGKKLARARSKNTMS